MGEPYGPYPTIDDFSQDYGHSQVSDESLTKYTSDSTANRGKLRRHAACDECRKRKLKCTGEPTGCSRCVKNAIPCVYSQQKQMGRPRKRQKTDEGPTSPATEDIQYAYAAPPPLPFQAQPRVEEQPQDPIDPSLSNIDQDLTDFHNVCPGPMAQTIRNQRESVNFRDHSTSTDLSVFDHNGDATSLDYPYTRYPTDISLWPDFSTIDKLPLPLTTKWDPDPANDLTYPTPSTGSASATDAPKPYYDPDADPAALAMLPTIPSCPCLPNLYLALSTLSTLSSFPVSQHTIDTLLSSHRTAHSVIYCPVCPQQYQSGSQNLMIGCTLLNVIADHWHRIRNTPSEGLKKGFGGSQHPNQPNGNTSFISLKEGQSWRAFVRQLIRAYVFGDAPIPKPPNFSSSSNATPPDAADFELLQGGSSIPETNTLAFLISALERRQRQWHQLDTPTDEFPDRSVADHPAWARGPEHAHAHHSSRNMPATGSRKVSTDGATDSAAEHESTACDGGSRIAKSYDGEHNHDHARPGHDNMMCLVIICHSKNILRALDEQK